MRYLQSVELEELKGLDTMRVDGVIAYGKVKIGYRAPAEGTDMIIIEGHDTPIDIGRGDVNNPRPSVEGLAGLYFVHHPDRSIQFIQEDAFLSFRDNRQRQDNEKNEKVDRYESIFRLIGETIEGIKNES